MTGRVKDPRKKPHKTNPNSLKALAEHRKPFVKGDERINRKGAPSNTSAMRALIREIGADLVALSSPGVGGRKRTHIASRITKKIIDMYDSGNPADSIALLKAAYPGLLADEDEGKKGPQEIVLKVVYENKRAAPDEEELVPEDVEEGQEIVDDKSDRGTLIIAPAPLTSRLGVQLADILSDEHTSEEIEEESFYCVLCKDLRPEPRRSSVEAGGWICSLHSEVSDGRS